MKIESQVARRRSYYYTLRSRFWCTAVPIGNDFERLEIFWGREWKRKRRESWLSLAPVQRAVDRRRADDPGVPSLFENKKLPDFTRLDSVICYRLVVLSSISYNLCYTWSGWLFSLNTFCVAEFFSAISAQKLSMNCSVLWAQAGHNLVNWW